MDEVETVQEQALEEHAVKEQCVEEQVVETQGVEAQGVEAQSVEMSENSAEASTENEQVSECAKPYVSSESAVEEAKAEGAQDEAKLPTDMLSIEALVEALIFANGEPIGEAELARVSGLSKDEVEAALSGIEMRYQEENFGFELVKVANQYQFRTKAAFSRFVRELKADKPRKLSNAALETLAIIAYRQPVVKSDIEKIRGVDVTPTLKTLLERSVIKIVGHQPTPGQPALYGTTDEFLKLFGLNSLSELPTLRDISEFEKDPGETSEPEEEEAQEGSDTENSEPVEAASEPQPQAMEN